MDLLQYVHFKYCRSPSLWSTLLRPRWRDPSMALHGFTVSFAGLLSASENFCCANPCKTLCTWETQQTREELLFPWSPCIVLYCSENYNILMFKFTLLLCLSMQQTICQHSCYRGLGLGDGKHGDVLSLCGLEEWICLASSLACCLSYCFWVGEFAMLMVAKIDQKMHSIHL